MKNSIGKIVSILRLAACLPAESAATAQAQEKSERQTSLINSKNT